MYNTCTLNVSTFGIRTCTLKGTPNVYFLSEVLTIIAGGHGVHKGSVCTNQECVLTRSVY